MPSGPQTPESLKVSKKFLQHLFQTFGDFFQTVGGYLAIQTHLGFWAWRARQTLANGGQVPQTEISRVKGNDTCIQQRMELYNPLQTEMAQADHQANRSLELGKALQACVVNSASAILR